MRFARNYARISALNVLNYPMGCPSGLFVLMLVVVRNKGDRDGHSADAGVGMQVSLSCLCTDPTLASNTLEDPTRLVLPVRPIQKRYI